MSVFILLLRREARLLFRRPAELANPLVFFAIVVALFPLAVGPESQLLQTLSPGLVWVARPDSPGGEVWGPGSSPREGGRGSLPRRQAGGLPAAGPLSVCWQ